MHDEGVPRTRRELVLTQVGALTAGKVLSTLAVWTTNIAGAILVFELTGSALVVGLVSVLQFTPQLLLTPFFGARADRSDRLVQLVAGTTVTALGSLLLVLWALTAGFTMERDAAVVVLAAGLVGIGFSVAGPAQSSLLPALVRRSELADALALSSLPIIVARSLGPAFGATLYLTSGATVTFTVSLLLHVGFLLVLAVLRGRIRPAPRETRAGADRRVRAGLAYLRRSPRTMLQILGVGLIGVAVDPVTTLTPSLVDALGAPSRFVGTLASAFGLGTAAGFLVLSRVRLRVGILRLGAVGLTIMGGGMLLVALAPTPSLAVVGISASGAGMTFALNAFTTLVQSDVPDELRGRVMALWSVAFLGSRPATALITGTLADLVGVRVALAVSASTVLAGAFVTRGSRMEPRPVDREA